MRFTLPMLKLSVVILSSLAVLLLCILTVCCGFNLGFRFYKYYKWFVWCFNILDCDSPMGMESGQIPNSALTATTEVLHKLLAMLVRHTTPYLPICTMDFNVNISWSICESSTRNFLQTQLKRWKCNSV